eukprot:XP_011615886.1 PREDICTED: arrestin domain-containing protein 1-like [Takifugu rubripes]
MGKLQEFDITFTNNKVVYGPGESMSGTVKIRTGNPLQYKAIKVNCQGSCGISNKLNDSSWAVEEQYFNSTLSVADKGTLAAGEHSFPFQFVIPGECGINSCCTEPHFSMSGTQAPIFLDVCLTSVNRSALCRCDNL